MKKNNCVRLRRLPVMLVASLVFVLALGISGCGTTTSNGSAKKAESQKMTLVHKGKLTVVSDLANPPFDYMEGQTKKGFEVELMQELAKKMGLECEYLNPMKFDSIIPTIKQGGKADVGASNFTITEERQKEIDFTNAYIDSNQGLVTAKGVADQIGANTKTLDNASSTIAVQAGTTGESWVKENLPNATVVALDDPIAALSGVRNSSAHAPFMSSSRMRLAEAKPSAAPPSCPTPLRGSASGISAAACRAMALQYSTPRMSFGCARTAAFSPSSLRAAASRAAAKETPSCKP